MPGYATSVSFDGTNLVLEQGKDDGSRVTVRLAAGTHTAAEHDAAVTALRQAYTTLRQWSLDAQDAFNTWPTKTAAQKDATQRETIRRLGVFFDRFADFMVASNADS